MLQNEIDSVDNLIQERRKILNEQRQANVIDRLKVFQRSEIEVMINDMIQQVKVNNDSFIEKTSGIVIEYNTENLIGGSLKVQAPSSIMRHGNLHYWRQISF